MSNDTRLLDAFDECLSRLKSGESIPNCLRRYPDLEKELWPMLMAAQAALRASQVPPQSQIRSREQFLSTARPQQTPAMFGGFGRVLATGLTMAATLALGTTGLYVASASSIPGDRLYTVKRTFEDLQLGLTTDPAARLRLEDQFSQRRDGEIQAAVSQGRTVDVTFSGVLVSSSGSVWQVGSYQVRVTDTTTLVGQPQDGFLVRVAAKLDGNALTAGRIEVDEQQLAGRLRAAGSGWSIGGVSFNLLPDTLITGVPAAGANATARVRQLRPGDFVALSLTVTESQPSASPSPTHAPTRVATQSISTADTATEDAAPTSEPTETTQPTETQQVEHTPIPPQATDTPGSSTQPTETPDGSPASETPKPSYSPGPDLSPEPTHRRESTQRPEDNHPATSTPDH